MAIVTVSASGMLASATPPLTRSHSLSSDGQEQRTMLISPNLRATPLRLPRGPFGWTPASTSRPPDNSSCNTLSLCCHGARSSLSRFARRIRRTLPGRSGARAIYRQRLDAYDIQQVFVRLHCEHRRSWCFRSGTERWAAQYLDRRRLRQHNVCERSRIRCVHCVDVFELANFVRAGSNQQFVRMGPWQRR